jgi:dual specificity phosphatase 12
MSPNLLFSAVRILTSPFKRRELAMRDHIIEHEPGMGQQAFAIHRRDMSKHREEQERRRELERLKEAARAAATTFPPKTNGASPAASDKPPVARTLSTRVPPNLRVALPVSSTAGFNADESALSISPPTPDQGPLLSSPSCSSYFTEPLSWMSNQLEEGQLGGKLVCPNKKCGAKLGSFDWAGSQCSCGAWVTPGFSILASKVDEVG